MTKTTTTAPTRTPLDADRNAAINRQIMRRLIATVIGSVMMVGISAVAISMYDATLWLQAAISAGLVWIACTASIGWLAYTALTAPNQVFKAFALGMTIHFTAVAGGGALLATVAGFNPIAAMLPPLATCMACIFGGAWMVQQTADSISTLQTPASANDSGPDESAPVQTGDSSGGGGTDSGFNGQIVEAHS